MNEPRPIGHDGHGAPLFSFQLDPATYCLAEPSTRIVVKYGYTPICTLRRDHDGGHHDESLTVDWTELSPGIYVNVST